MVETLACETETALSSATRLVNHTLPVLDECDCFGTRRTVCVLHGFDGDSRRRARQIRDRLIHRGVSAFTAAVAMVALDPRAIREQHVCLYVDANDEPGEAGRFAALMRGRLVTLTQSLNDPSEQKSTAPTLRASFHPAVDRVVHPPFPSSLGHVPDIAFDEFVISPNQPEVGELSVRVGNLGTQSLRSGTTISLRCLPEAILVEAIDPQGKVSAWLRQEVEVRQHSGLHQVFRDGLSVTDLEDFVTVQHQPRGLRRHHA